MIKISSKMKSAHTPIHPHTLTPTLLLLLLAATSLHAESKKQEFRAVTPAWVVEGKTSQVQLLGQDLAPKQVVFEDTGITARVLKTGPFAPKNDDEKKQGNTAVDLEITPAANLKPGHYPFKLLGDGVEPASGWITVQPPAPEIHEIEPNDTLAKPQALPPGSVTVLGKLDNEGVDVFQVAGKAGETWRFEIFARRLSPSAKLEPVLRLRDPRLVSIRAAVDEGEDCFIEYKLPMDGPYLLEVFDGDNRSGGDFDYRLAVTRL